MLRHTTLMEYLTVSALAANLNGSASAPDCRAEAVKAVQEIEDAWIKTARSKDVSQWASFLAEEAIGLYPGAPTLNGRAALQAAMARYMSDPNFSLVPQPSQAVAANSGDMVYSFGTYTMTVTSPDTKTVIHDKGKYLTVYRKYSHGQWKVAVDTFNSDLQP